MTETLNLYLQRAREIIDSCFRINPSGLSAESFVSSLTENYKPLSIPKLKNITKENLVSLGLSDFSATCVCLAWQQISTGNASVVNSEILHVIAEYITEHARHGPSSVSFQCENGDYPQITTETLISVVLGETNFVSPPPPGCYGAFDPELTITNACRVLSGERLSNVTVVNGMLREVLPFRSNPELPVRCDPADSSLALSHGLRSDSSMIDWEFIPSWWISLIHHAHVSTRELGNRLTIHSIFDDCSQFQSVIDMCPDAAVSIARMQRLGLTQPGLCMPQEVGLTGRHCFETSVDSYRTEYKKLSFYMLSRYPDFSVLPSNVTPAGRLLIKCLESYSWGDTSTEQAEFLNSLSQGKPCLVVDKNGKLDIPRTYYVFGLLTSGLNPGRVFYQKEDFYEILPLGEQPLCKPLILDPFNAWQEAKDNPNLNDLDVVKLSILYYAFNSDHEEGIFSDYTNYLAPKEVKKAQGDTGLEWLVETYPRSAYLVAQRLRCGLSVPVLVPMLPPRPAVIKGKKST